MRLDAGNGCAELADFSVLVQPSINPELSDYFTGLTGITNAAAARSALRNLGDHVEHPSYGAELAGHLADLLRIGMSEVDEVLVGIPAHLVDDRTGRLLDMDARRGTRAGPRPACR